MAQTEYLSFKGTARLGYVADSPARPFTGVVVAVSGVACSTTNPRELVTEARAGQAPAPEVRGGQVIFGDDAEIFNLR
jgi:hypothetical protein